MVKNDANIYNLHDLSYTIAGKQTGRIYQKASFSDSGNLFFYANENRRFFGIVQIRHMIRNSSF